MAVTQTIENIPMCYSDNEERDKALVERVAVAAAALVMEQRGNDQSQTAVVSLFSGSNGEIFCRV